MKSALQRQEEYWNQESKAFDTIYSKQKSSLSVWLDSVFRKDMYLRFAFTIDHSEPVNGKTFLDVGCGTGRYAIELAKRGAANVYGLDIAEEMITIAEHFAKEDHVDHLCTFIHSDLLKYHYDKKVHTTIGMGLFDYVKDPVPILKKMRDVSSECVIISFPKLFTWRMPIRKMRLSLRGCDVYFYSRKRIEQVMYKAGFKSILIEKVGKLFCVVGKV